LVPFKNGRRDKGDAKQQCGWIRENSFNISEFAAKIFKEEIIPFLHGEVCFNRAEVNEQCIFIESLNMVEGRLM
jgi:hypothetical protein